MPPVLACKLLPWERKIVRKYALVLAFVNKHGDGIAGALSCIELIQVLFCNQEGIPLWMVKGIPT